jgi:8-oxo-dGTP pyrophosphatase MutT (NUDIX family)
MKVNHRVRGIILCGADRLLVIKRIKPKKPHYYVTCGGGVEDDDDTLEDALKREIMEELGARVRVLRKVLVIDTKLSRNFTLREHFFVCRLIDLNLARRSGTELLDPDRGKYLPYRLSLRPASFQRVDFRPAALRLFIVEHATRLARLPDLRRKR